MAVAGGGIICASNYEARKYGIRSAMPTAVCVKLCPSLLVIEANGQKYNRISKESERIYARYDKNFTMLSIDEALVNLTESVQQRLAALGQMPRPNIKINPRTHA